MIDKVTVTVDGVSVDFIPTSEVQESAPAATEATEVAETPAEAPVEAAPAEEAVAPAEPAV